mmetsp:Transcript_24239/g.72366  ORF Transcript_24239/g.72366 Transcript_24239/m.72366 type:complete len:467 (+) Transcript_24239:35-1435(+)
MPLSPRAAPAPRDQYGFDKVEAHGGYKGTGLTEDEFLAQHEGANWATAPENDGGDIVVGCRFNLISVQEIKTVEQTVKIKLEIVLYWEDYRLRDPRWGQVYSGPDALLPTKMWAPSFRVQGTHDFPDVRQERFSQADDDVAKMVRSFTMIAVVDNMMDELEHFPFDYERVGVTVQVSPHWSSRDMSMKGELMSRRMRLVKATPSLHGPSASKFLKLKLRGEVREWEVVGVSTRLTVVNSKAATSLATADVTLSVHCRRRMGYYAWKVLVPLYMLALLSFSVFFYDPQDFIPRNEAVAIYFLAGTSLLYIVDGALPKTDKPTTIDLLVLCWVATLVFVGVVSVVLSRVTDADEAEVINTWAGVALAVLYTVANAVILMPPFLGAQANASDHCKTTERPGTEFNTPWETSQESIIVKTPADNQIGRPYFVRDAWHEYSPVSLESDGSYKWINASPPKVTMAATPFGSP